MKASDTGLLVRLSIGSRKAFTAQAFTIASLLVLISGSTALMNVPRATTLAQKAYGAYVSLILATIGDVLTILWSWSLIVWLLVFAAVYVLTAHTLAEFNSTASLLQAIGSSRSKILDLVLVRMILLGIVGWLVGSSAGLVLAQLSFRGMAYVSGAPYEIPVLFLSDLFFQLFFALSAILLGSLAPLFRFRKAIGR